MSPTTTISELREQGNAAFKQGDWVRAIEAYTQAIHRLTTTTTNTGDNNQPHHSHKNDQKHVVSLYSNRSAAYLKLGQVSLALQDAQWCIALKPDYAKGYSRQSAAYLARHAYDHAISTFQQGLLRCPQQQQEALLKGLATAQRLCSGNGDVQPQQQQSQPLQSLSPQQEQQQQQQQQQQHWVQQREPSHHEPQQSSEQQRQHQQQPNFVRRSSRSKAPASHGVRTTTGSSATTTTDTATSATKAQLARQRSVVARRASLREPPCDMTHNNHPSDATPQVRIAGFGPRQRRHVQLQLAAWQAQLEFLDLLDQLTMPAKLQLLFNVVDRDRDGTVSAKELALLLQQHAALFAHSKNTKNQSKLQPPHSNNASSSIWLDQAIATVAIFDADGDARLNLNEFCEYIRVWLAELEQPATLAEFADYLVLQTLFLPETNDPVQERRRQPQSSPRQSQSQLFSSSLSFFTQDGAASIWENDEIDERVKSREQLLAILGNERLLELFDLLDQGGNRELSFHHVAITLYQLIKDMEPSVAKSTLELLLMMDDYPLPDNRSGAHAGGGGNASTNHTNHTKKRPKPPRIMNYEQFGRLMLGFVAVRGKSFEEVADELVLTLLTKSNKNIPEHDWQVLLLDRSRAAPPPPPSLSPNDDDKDAEAAANTTLDIDSPPRCLRQSNSLRRKSRRWSLRRSTREHHINKDDDTNERAQQTEEYEDDEDLESILYGKLDKLFDLWDTAHQGTVDRRLLERGFALFEKSTKNHKNKDTSASPSPSSKPSVSSPTTPDMANAPAQEQQQQQESQSPLGDVDEDEKKPQPHLLSRESFVNAVADYAEERQKLQQRAVDLHELIDFLCLTTVALPEPNVELYAQAFEESHNNNKASAQNEGDADETDSSNNQRKQSAAAKQEDRIRLPIRPNYVNGNDESTTSSLFDGHLSLSSLSTKNDDDSTNNQQNIVVIVEPGTPEKDQDDSVVIRINKDQLTDSVVVENEEVIAFVTQSVTEALQGPKEQDTKPSDNMTEATRTAKDNEETSMQSGKAEAVVEERHDDAVVDGENNVAVEADNLTREASVSLTVETTVEVNSQLDPALEEDTSNTENQRQLRPGEDEDLKAAAVNNESVVSITVSEIPGPSSDAHESATLSNMEPQIQKEEETLTQPKQVEAAVALAGNDDEEVIVSLGETRRADELEKPHQTEDIEEDKAAEQHSKESAETSVSNKESEATETTSDGTNYIIDPSAQGEPDVDNAEESKRQIHPNREVTDSALEGTNKVKINDPSNTETQGEDAVAEHGEADDEVVSSMGVSESSSKSTASEPQKQVEVQFNNGDENDSNNHNTIVNSEEDLNITNKFNAAAAAPENDATNEVIDSSANENPERNGAGEEKQIGELVDAAAEGRTKVEMTDHTDDEQQDGEGAVTEQAPVNDKIIQSKNVVEPVSILATEGSPPKQQEQEENHESGDENDSKILNTTQNIGVGSKIATNRSNATATVPQKGAELKPIPDPQHIDSTNTQVPVATPRSSPRKSYGFVVPSLADKSDPILLEGEEDTPPIVTTLKAGSISKFIESNKRSSMASSNDSDGFFSARDNNSDNSSSFWESD
ncbi:hypothetical protein ACA910_007686 [Epithemia clementina (nom. ined.)]